MPLTDTDIEEEAFSIAKACWEAEKLTDRQYHVWLMHMQGMTLYRMRLHKIEDYDNAGSMVVTLYSCHTATLYRELIRAKEVIQTATYQKHFANITSDIAVARGHVLDLAPNDVLEQSYWKCRNFAPPDEKVLTTCEK